MSTRSIELEARFIQQLWRDGDFVIGRAKLVNGSVALAAQNGIDSDELIIKGDAPADDLQSKQTYRFYGTFCTYREERQFKFTHYVPAVSHDREGVVAYLEAAGRGLGLGSVTAGKAFDRWGSDAVRVIRENPRELFTLDKRIRISDVDLAALKAKLDSQAKTEHAQIEVTNLLAGRGFPKSLYRKTIKIWGNQAAIRIRRDPYQLMRFRGCGFKMCDKLYLELGLKPDALRRQALCAWYAIASDSEGHTWYPIELAKQAVRRAIGPTSQPEKAIELATRLARLSPDHYGALAIMRTNAAGQITDDGPRLWVAEGRKAAAERRLAELVVSAMDESTPRSVTEYEKRTRIEQTIAAHARCHRCSRELTAPEVHIWNGRPFGPTCITYISDGTDVEVVPLREWLERNPDIKKIIEELPRRVVKLPEFSLWPEAESIELIDAHQRENLSLALTGRIGILGGSPGTGKTHTIVQLIRALLKSGRIGPDDIAIGAPTGKAAVRINQGLTAARLPMRALTWHSLLGVGEPDEESGAWSFKYNAGNPWPFRVIIGDEESMKDTAIMCSVLSARARGCHVLLVGDIYQLPPVGSGAPLRDLIAAGLPYGHLTEIKRNSGGIVEACAAIRDGRGWTGGDNLVIVDATTPESQLDFVVTELGRLSGQCDPVWDAQTIVPVNAKSPLSRKLVNERLQLELNPNPAIAGSPFRLHDKVVCTSNGWYRQVPEFDTSSLDSAFVRETDVHGVSELYVANGELGRVLTVEEKRLTIEFFEPHREILVPRGKSDQKADSGDDDDDDKSSTGCNFELGYAISCHRMQGSEVPYTFLMIDEYQGAKNICSLEWMITGLSRAKTKCRVVGRKSTADGFCKRRALNKRKTFLRELILLLKAEKMLEAMR
jgi:ATP-dependent exoDNAse (exonuclease V) alpha subunit